MASLRRFGRRSTASSKFNNADEPIVIADTPSPAKSNSAAHSVRTSGTNTPATSVETADGDEKKIYELSPELEGNVQVVIEREPTRLAKKGKDRAATSKRKRVSRTGVKKEEREEEVQRPNKRIASSSKQQDITRKQDTEEEDDDDDLSDIDDSLIKSLGLGKKGKEKEKEEQPTISVADYCFDSDDELKAVLGASRAAAGGGGFVDDEETEDEKPVMQRAAGKRAVRPVPKRKADSIPPSDEESSDGGEFKEPDDVGWDDSDFSDEDYGSSRKRNRANAKPRARARKAATIPEPSDEEEEEEEEEEDSELSDSEGESADMPLAATAGPTAGADVNAAYETAKQRAKRLKREQREARAEARAKRTGKRRAKKRSQYEKNYEALVQHHPELKKIWTDLAATPSQKPEMANQPDGLNIKLLPFQREGLNWLIKQEKSLWKGGVLADEMGMGKTIQIISLFLSDRKKPNLVVAPTVAILQWRNEIEKYTQGFKVIVWHGSDRSSDVQILSKADVVLTSYGTMESAFRKQVSGSRKKGLITKTKSPLHAVKWHRVVLDEAHNIKERATNTAKSAFELKSTNRWCLSGTPLQNRVGELYSMIRFLGGDPYSFYFCKRCPCKSLHWQFSDRRNCDKCGHTPMHHVCLWNNEILKPIQNQGTTTGEGRDAFARLRLLLDRMMLRRTKLERADDMGLPPRTIEVRRDLFNEEEEELYESLYRDTARKFTTYIDQGTVLNNYSNVFTLLTRMRQCACHPDLVFKSKTGMKSVFGEEASNAANSVHVCRICQDEAEDAIMSKCRHIFCRECVRQWMGDGLVGEGETVPECPYCHATLTIDLEGEALEPPVQGLNNHGARGGIISRIDMDKWRSSSKIEALVEELTQLRSEDKTIKSLVFSQFVNFLDLIAFRLHRAGFQVCRLEGHMTPEARNKTIEHFMNNVGVTVFLVSLKAGGVALNLTEASRVYLMDPWWNPSVEVQAMDRIHRLGQHRPIIVKRMVIENSIETRIIELQNKKSAMIEAAIGKDDSAMGRLSVMDLRFLFSL
ncbi:hypothetical protein FA10DRAFT_236159 [Acaromyces ingoldii]|uniref:Uncharacterized protein n=1 Tax=Acaromyces ingoldii TaxID=215250 RepID=A0A316YVW0_9BASI|nr:hypothetical protein FA10DRAFT_236159 [Acaromyces ingoldii]PWN92904.1 hypothetical protein FA10DRAFT_236159 [Acaromyces ingoldii]